MNLLLTSARMPFALDEVRKFGRSGHRVFTADSLLTAPGGHSRYVAAHGQVASPQYRARQFIDDIQQLVRVHAIELIVPCFEEVFYLARHVAELTAPLFAPPIEILSELHNKASFNHLARRLGIGAAASSEVKSPAELAAAIASYNRFMARPVWSRGGVNLFTNAGPLAGALDYEDCRPTTLRPWIVQEYIDGVDLSTFSVAYDGRVLAHCAYVHPLEIEHGGGIVFESVAEPETLEVVQRLVAATGYHGQLGLDFRRDGRRLCVTECNPRPTAGVHLMPDELVVDSALAPPPSGPPRVVPAGVRRKYSSAIVRDLLRHLGHAPADLLYLLSRQIEDVYGEHGDRLPALYQVLSYVQVLSYRLHHRRPPRSGTALMAAYFDGIEWNGDAIP